MEKMENKASETTQEVSHLNRLTNQLKESNDYNISLLDRLDIIANDLKRLSYPERTDISPAKIEPQTFTEKFDDILSQHQINSIRFNKRFISSQIKSYC